MSDTPRGVERRFGGTKRKRFVPLGGGGKDYACSYVGETPKLIVFDTATLTASKEAIGSGLMSFCA